MTHLEPEEREKRESERETRESSRGEESAEVAGLREKVAQLEQALQSRIIIEQAKGMLAERLSIDVHTAFDIIRYAARSHRIKLRDVAHSVVNERETPAPVVVAVARNQRVRAAWMRDLAQAQSETNAALRANLEALREAGWAEFSKSRSQRAARQQR